MYHFFICSTVDRHLEASTPRRYVPTHHCIHVSQGPSPLVSRSPPVFLTVSQPHPLLITAAGPVTHTVKPGDRPGGGGSVVLVPGALRGPSKENGQLMLERPELPMAFGPGCLKPR